MSKNRVVHFEIPASDFEKAKQFYEKIFDWKLEVWEGEGIMAYTTEVDKDQNPVEAGGINGGFYKRSSKEQQPSFVVETDSIDETLQKVVEAGGEIITPKHPIDDAGFMADFADHEGNQMTLWENIKR